MKTRRLLIVMLILGSCQVGCGPPPDTAPGVTWTHRKSPGEEMSGIVWSGTQFVAVGWGVLTSPDGVSWTSRQVPVDWRLEGVTWGGSQFVAFGHSAPDGRTNIVTSSDGVTWTERSIPSSVECVDVQDVAWSGDRFVAVGGCTTLSSSDGATWSAQRLQIDGRLVGVTWGGSQFVAVGYVPGPRESSGGFTSTRAIIVTSPDGVTWTQRSAAASGLKDVAWSGEQLVAVGDAILTSPDGVTWSTQSAPVDRYGLEGVTWGGSQFVAVGENIKSPNRDGLIVTSPDGNEWTRRAVPTSGCEPLDVAWSGSRFVAVGRLRRGWFADYTTVLILASP